MAFDGAILTIVGLLKIELPGRTVLLCDGGFCRWGAETFESRDAVFGTIAAIEAIEEGLGDEAEGGRVTLLPAPGADRSTLSSKGHQNARIRGWLGEIGSNGATVTTARPLFDGLIDTTRLMLGRAKLELEITFMGRAEKLFALNEGNTLSPRFHKKVWPGEEGLDNANGAQITVAWGASDAERGTKR